jgi:hypothetical protein
LLKNIICNYNIEYNFLNLDIQGAELKALKGMEEYLNDVDYLYEPKTISLCSRKRTGVQNNI